MHQVDFCTLFSVISLELQYMKMSVHTKIGLTYKRLQLISRQLLFLVIFAQRICCCEQFSNAFFKQFSSRRMLIILPSIPDLIKYCIWIIVSG